MRGISPNQWRRGACSDGSRSGIGRSVLLLRCLLLIAIAMMLGCQRSSISLPSIDDAGPVCGFWIDDDQFHVMTATHHWIWRDERWHREPGTGGRCPPPARFFRTPGNLVIDLSEGKLTLAPATGDALKSSGDSPWIIDLIVRSPPPYFSAQRDYGPYPIRIYAIDLSGSVWRGSVTRSRERLLVERIYRLAEGAHPLRLALDEDKLFVLYRRAGALHIDARDTVFESAERLKAL